MTDFGKIQPDGKPAGANRGQELRKQLEEALGPKFAKCLPVNEITLESLLETIKAMKSTLDHCEEAAEAQIEAMKWLEQVKAVTMIKDGELILLQQTTGDIDVPHGLPSVLNRAMRSAGLGNVTWLILPENLKLEAIPRKHARRRLQGLLEQIGDEE